MRVNLFSSIKWRIFLLLAMVGLSGCQEQDNSLAPQDTLVAVIQIAKPQVEVITTTLPGRVEAFQRAEVRARVSGIVLNKTYQEGQDVEQGEVLFGIDPEPLQLTLQAAQARLAQAQAAYSLAKDQLKRYRQLTPRQVISEYEFLEATLLEEKSRAELASAAVEVKQAELALSYSQVTAPISGRVGKAFVTQGAFVRQEEATLLARIEQVDPIYVTFFRPASDVLTVQKAIQQNQLQLPSTALPVTLILANGDEYAVQGEVTFTDLGIDPLTDNIEMKAQFANTAKTLLPGAYVQIRMVSAVHPKAFYVPREAVIRTGNGSVLRIVNSENIVEERLVQTEQIKTEFWLVTQGLQGGERIIIENSSQFRPGSKVDIQEAL